MRNAEFGLRNGGDLIVSIHEGSDLQLFNLDAFKADLAAALDDLQAAGVRCAVLTTIVVGNDLQNPVNSVLRLYNRAIREAATEHDALLVDVERAFRDVFDRAANYKQKLALTGPDRRPQRPGPGAGSADVPGSLRHASRN